jgi:hypothetical protein
MPLSRKSRSTRFKKIVKEGIEAALLPAGFVPTGKPLTWGRSARELTHLVGVHRRATTYSVQWSVGCPPATWLLWGDGDPRDIGYCVMAGTPSDIVRPSHGDGWTLDDTSTPAGVANIALGLKSDLDAVAKRLESFTTRRVLWTYLLQNRNPVDHRDFLIPAKLPFKLAAAAALALAGGDVEGCDLADDAALALRGFKDKLHREQAGRLRAAASKICT